MTRIVTLVALLAGLVPADEAKTVAVGDSGKQIVEWVRKAELAGFRGAVLAAKDGRVVAATGVGMAQAQVPNTAATLFEIASATKQFTAAAALRLVDAGKLDLDASIARYLPGVPESCKAITVRHLLQHTSGIPGTNSKGGGTDLAAVMPVFLKGGPAHPPGTHWEYWNQGYALASEVIARASGSSYTDYCKKALFRPAKMRHTLFTGDAAPRKDVVAVGRSTRGPSRSALDHPYGAYGFQYRGMGGAVTTVWDLWRWHRALNGKLLSKKAKQELFKPGLKDYALGWFVRKSDGVLVQSHGGGVRGFVCEVRRYPDHDGCVFVLANADDAPVRLVADGIEQALLGRPITVRLPKRLAGDIEPQLLGTFVDARGNRLDVEKSGGTLRATIKWKAGMVSRMKFGRDDQGQLAVFQGGKSYAVEVGELKDGKAQSVSFLDTRYDREK